MTKIPYVTFMKHAQKVVKSPMCKTRPVLAGVIHRDNYVAVTDSHRLYYATDMYEGEEKNISPITGAEVEGNFPDIGRLIPVESDVKSSAAINVDETAKALKLIEQAGKIDKKTDLTVIESNGNSLNFKTDEEAVVHCEYNIETEIDGESFVMYAIAKYLSEGLALIKDAGFTEATFNFYGDNRPFTITSGNLTVLILTTRK